MSELAPNSVLPAQRESITLVTDDGLRLIGELAMPESGQPDATFILCHPNPTGGGMMDSHLYRKAAWRLPALANVAILRFNTRGTTSAAGTSEGSYDEGRNEKFDLKAAIDFAVARDLQNIWLMGWSFGTNVVISHGNVDPVQGAILFSPTMKWSTTEELAQWATTGRPLTALVPELDDYMLPDEAREVFSIVPQCDVVAIPECKHLWVGEKFVRIAWNEVLKRVFPHRQALTWMWDGPIQKWDDLQGKLI